MLRTFDLIVFGDEVPGILGLVSAAREYRRQTGQYPRTLVMTKSNANPGIGGHLVRGELSYLDRSSVSSDLRQHYQLDTFGDPPAIYKEFLDRSNVDWVALDPQAADTALRQMLGEVGAYIVSNVEIDRVLKTGNRLSGIQLTRGDTYLARQFLDATVNAELAQFAGVEKQKGFATFGLPEAELPVTLCFQTEGLSIAKLKHIEASYLQRLSDPNDALGQQWLQRASGGSDSLAKLLRNSFTDKAGRPLTLYSDRDFVDVRSRALSIVYHAHRNQPFSLKDSGFVLDNGNIAVLSGGRLSWNSLLFFVTGSEAEALARNTAKPNATMLAEFQQVRQWFQESLGAIDVKPAAELYIRHAGNVTGVVSPLSGAQMLKGGVEVGEALGTFGYHFDVRGGIDGLGQQASERGYKSVSVHTKPLFNIGIRHAQLREPPNLAVVSPASGFEGYAAAAGRIVEFNAGVAQGLGIAAALALIQGRQLSEISNTEVRRALARRGQLSKVYGIGQAEAATALSSFEKTLAPEKSIPPTEPIDIAGHWAEPYIKALFDRNIISGVGNNRFQPEEPLTRAAFAAVLARAFDRDSVRDSQVFLDVSPSFWGYNAIVQANRMGFMAGFPNGTFRPSQNVTRLQAYLALVSGLDLVGGVNPDVLSYYVDRNRIPSYAVHAIASASVASLIADYPNRRLFRPMQDMTRAEVAVAIYQTLTLLSEVPRIESPYIVTVDRLVDSDFSDIDTHWARDFIRELARKGLVNGYNDGSFRPDAPLTRATFASFLAKAFDPPPERPPAEFRDVLPTFWASRAIQQVYRGGFLSGLSETTFAPQLNVQRLQVLLALVNGRDLGGADASELARFVDQAEIPTWAQPAVATAFDRRLVVNYPDLDRLRPTADATRAEVAVMLYQALRDEGLWDLTLLESPYIADRETLS
ncbi:MAG: S-layer homology domain-containing protein [Cyanobacteria bacterium SBC]|nr:S-layer homology domain-containing protein [Cyanobacteria bacterium SBC]